MAANGIQQLLCTTFLQLLYTQNTHQSIKCAVHLVIRVIFVHFPKTKSNMKTDSSQMFVMISEEITRTVTLDKRLTNKRQLEFAHSIRIAHIFSHFYDKQTKIVQIQEMRRTLHQCWYLYHLSIVSLRISPFQNTHTHKNTWEEESNCHLNLCNRIWFHVAFVCVCMRWFF